MLLDGGLDRMIGDGIPGLVRLTPEERAASLAATLAARPDHLPGEPPAGIWVFAYGSLIWNPAMEFLERRFARLHGWHRSFCLSTSAGRGTPDLPGLVLGLDRGGACAGAAFLIADAALETELALLWCREMLAGSYTPRWVTLRNAAGIPFGHAIAFTINRTAQQYTGLMTETDTVDRLSRAAGPLGSSADYLFQTRDGLRALGIKDRRIERLATQVETQLAKNRAEP
jgi:cation transport protein ChaC